MNIFITGGTGFLGSHLARLLSRGHKVLAAARGKSADFLMAGRAKNISFVNCDLTNKDSLNSVLSSQIDLIIHCAGLIDINYGARNTDELFRNNVLATINLLDAMSAKGVKKLVYSSSMTVYGLKNSSPVVEDSSLEPIHFYGLSKKWAEEAIAGYLRFSKIKSLILRFPGLYGFPRNSGYIYNVARNMLNNRQVTVDSSGLKFWEAMYIEDAADLAVRLIRNWNWAEKLGVFNCSYGREVDFVKTALKIKMITGSSSSLRIKKPLDYRKFYLSNRKIRKLVKFDLSFDDGLQRFINRHREWLAG
jgi:UDP-glucose 4-epimerase